jgi:hypothetical protein
LAEPKLHKRTGNGLRSTLGFLSSIKGVPVLGMPNVTVPRMQEYAVSFTNGCNTLPLDHLLHVLGGHNPWISRGILFGYGKLSPPPATPQRPGGRRGRRNQPPRRAPPEWTQSGRADTFVVHETSIVVKSSLRCVDADVTRPVELRADSMKQLVCSSRRRADVSRLMRRSIDQLL